MGGLEFPSSTSAMESKTPSVVQTVIATQPIATVPEEIPEAAEESPV